MWKLHSHMKATTYVALYKNKKCTWKRSVNSIDEINWKLWLSSKNAFYLCEVFSNFGAVKSRMNISIQEPELIYFLINYKIFKHIWNAKNWKSAQIQLIFGVLPCISALVDLICGALQINSTRADMHVKTLQLKSSWSEVIRHIYHL